MKRNLALPHRVEQKIKIRIDELVILRRCYYGNKGFKKNSEIIHHKSFFFLHPTLSPTPVCATLQQKKAVFLKFSMSHI